MRTFCVAVVALTVAMTLGCGGGGGGGGGGQTGPRVISVVPSTGSNNGGDLVTVTVADFTDDFTVNQPTVTFGGNPATVLGATSPTVVQVTSPPSLTLGWVAVAVQSTGVVETGSRAQGFRYVTPPPVQPTITSICPDQGVNSGGDVATVLGTDFVSTPRVFFGAVEGTVVFVSDTELTVTSPFFGGDAVVDVTVRNPQGLEDSLAGGWEFRPDIGPDINEPNETISTCDAVGSGVTVTANIHNNQDLDYWCINATAGPRSVELITNTGGVDFDLEVYDSLGTLVGSSYLPAPQVDVVVTPSGATYVAFIVSNCGEIGEYDLSNN